MTFTPEEEARLDAEAEAEDRKAISRMPSWRALFGDDAKFTVGIFLLLVMALVQVVARVVLIAALAAAALTLIGAELGQTSGWFFGVAIGALVVDVMLIAIVKALK